jgi:Lon protease-like protein
MPDDPQIALPDEFKPLVAILQGVLEDLGLLYEKLDRRYDDAGWVGFRFAEVLPIDNLQKQACLELQDPLQRLRVLRSLLKDVRRDQLQG